MRALGVESSTLVGFEKRVGVFGNCFSVNLEDGDVAFVTNIGLESLQATGAAPPWEVELLSGNPDRCVLIDARVPKEALRDHGCEVHG